MSQVYEGSAPAVVDQLKLFEVPSTEKGVVRNEFIEYRPLGQVSTVTPVDFRICTEENQYLDLHRSLLKVRFRVVDKDDAPIATALSVAINDNILHTLWRQIDILLNQTLITSSTNNYAYKANIDTRLSDGTRNNTIVQAAGYVGSQFASGFNNQGTTIRKALVNEGKILTVCGPLRADVCSTKKWILPNIETVIRLWQTTDAFRIKTVAAHLDKAYKIDFQEIVFLANVITVHPEVTQAHKQLLKSVTAKYPYTRSQVHTYNIKAGSTFFKQDQIFQNRRPKRTTVVFFDTKAYQGDYIHEPFLYTAGYNSDQDPSEGITYIKTLDYTIDDKSVIGHPYELSLDGTDMGTAMTGYADLWYQRYAQMGQDCFLSNAGDYGAAFDQGFEDFTLTNFISGQCFFVFDDYAGLKRPANTVTEMRKGNAKINVVFKEALAGNITVLVYGEFDDMFEIDADKKVIVHHH